jgi:hypothetical protein
MEPLFYQQYCTVVPYQAGGMLVAGRKAVCSVMVVNGELVIDGDGGIIDRAPVSQVQIGTPTLQRKIGAATFVQMNSNRWAIDFGLTGQFDTSQRRGPFAKIKFARQRNHEFTVLLMREGAASLRAGDPSRH